MLAGAGVFGCSSGLDAKGTAYVKGRELFLNKDYDSAIEQLNKVIEMDEKFVDAYNLRGNCYSALKKMMKQLKTFQKQLR
jgi:tetratricopeptide (TPR) repeat protein